MTLVGSERHVVCKRSKPPPNTADAACIAIHDATQDRFLCKDQSKESWLPMVEWLAQALAKRCGLLIPDCFLIELEAAPGKYFFGSKWEGGAEQYSPGIVQKVTNPDEFSAIYAFDLLIHNVDRHLNNYLYLQLAGDTVVKAMDHSRCLWFSGWPLPPPPPGGRSNTVLALAEWCKDANWNRVAAEAVVNKWRQINKIDVEAIVDALPAGWMDTQQRDELVTWWGSSDWDLRSAQVVGALP